MSRPLYATTEMLRAELPTDLPAGAFDFSDLSTTIALWSGYIDDQLSGQYEVPFSPYPQTPPMVTVACVLLCTYYAYIKAGLPSEKDDPRTSLWGRAHDILDQIKRREVVLTDADGDPLTNPERSTPPLTIGPARGVASLWGQEVALGPVGGGGGRFGYRVSPDGSLVIRYAGSWGGDEERY